MGGYMIKRVLIKELLSFDKVNLEFDRGLNVITGPSGAGKSIFINALLANFGLSTQEAKLCEVELKKLASLESEVFDLDEDELIIKAIKKDRVRFFLNEQNISKKALKELFSKHILYLSVRDKSGFENETLLNLLDSFAIKQDTNFATLLEEYQTLFSEYSTAKQKLEQIKSAIKESNERVEFLKFEIEKIKSINPKEGEYEELLEIKRKLSKLDKITELAANVEAIFNYEDSAYELFELLNKDSSYLSDALNQLRSDLDDIESLKEELNEVNIEEVLDRLSDLDALIKRFGSIAEANEYMQEKIAELEGFERIEEDYSALEEFCTQSLEKLKALANSLTTTRKEASKALEDEIYIFLKELKLPKLRFEFSKRELFELGADTLNVNLEGSKIETLSGGEFNRVRLALLSVAAKRDGGVIILDEIDANVSGDESIAIANMIANLAKNYQVFAISHQAHLSSKANTHILVKKEKNKSIALKLDKEQRVKEIARIVGGENFNQEALEFAKGLFGNK